MLYCSHCGSENDNDARFCADCGMPIEDQHPHPDDDRTVASENNPFLEEAKTLAINNKDKQHPSGTDTTIQIERPPADFAASSPPATFPPQGTQSYRGHTIFSQRNIIIGLIIILLLICICVLLSVMIFLFIPAEELNNLMGQRGILSPNSFDKTFSLAYNLFL